MLFWHAGGTIWLFRWIFKDPSVDVRFLTVGALLPDLIDKPVGTLIAPDAFGASRLWGHTLLFSVVVMTLVMLMTRRGPARKPWMALSIGVYFHLILDAMWASRETFLWPFLGWEFTPGPADYWVGFLGRLFDSPTAIAGEVAGLAYLVFLWRRCALGDRHHRTAFLRTGVLLPVE